MRVVPIRQKSSWIVSSAAPVTQALPQPPGHDSCVRCEAAPGGEQTFGDLHPGDVGRARLAADQDDAVSAVGQRDRRAGSEGGSADRDPGGSGQAPGEDDILRIGMPDDRTTPLVLQRPLRTTDCLGPGEADQRVSSALATKVRAGWLRGGL
jgi:hypothetical protein